jgi:hypothetical protein
MQSNVFMTALRGGAGNETSVPEAATLGLTLFGLAGLALAARRRRSSAAPA